MSFGQTKANPSPLLQSPVILQGGGGTPGGTSGPPESEGGGNRGESQRHSHSLLTPVGSADMENVNYHASGNPKLREESRRKDRREGEEKQRETSPKQCRRP